MTRRRWVSQRIAWFVTATIAASTAGVLPVAWGQTATGPSIKFLSPTSFSGEVPTVTDDSNNGLNAAYRLSAWVANAPEGSLVEFELVPGDPVTKPITIGAGQAVTDDTYEYQWDIAEGPTGVVEGQHTLKATLYDSSSEELSVDTMVVNIIHGATAQAADEGETPIDMTYPVSGGPLGQYTASNGTTNSVFDSSKLGTSTVQAWFTTSPPGITPVWKLCNAGEPDTRFGDGVRCTYPADDPATKETNEAVDPTKVTAVGLVQAREDGSADVARAIPYIQDPTGLSYGLFGRKPTGTVDTDVPGSLTRQKDPNTGLFGCSDWVRVKVTDQVGRTVAGANLDAHAQGPSDQLKFHNSYLSAIQSPGLQPPSGGHSLPEPATKCIHAHDTVMKQGEHGLGGQADRKHVETTSGTADDGTFYFALESDQPGGTQLTIWMDATDDDKFCSGEAASMLAFGWGVDAPAPNGEQPADCTLVPEPEPEPFDGSRSATMELSRNSVRSGGRVTVVGLIDAADMLCQAGQTLKLKAKKPGASKFRTISVRTTDALGGVGYRVKVTATKLYRVVAPAAGECALAKSTIRKIRAI